MTSFSDAKAIWDPERYNNENGEGVIGSIETNPEHVYGGKGQSLKMVYDKTKTKWNSANFVHWDDFVCRGEGLAFWFKSDRSGTIYVHCLDGNWQSASKNKIPIIAGENIIQIPWSEFTSNGEPAKMTTIRQVIIGFDDGFSAATATGTVWLDAIGFFGVEQGTYDAIELDPPDEYDDFIDGGTSASEDFDSYSGDDDLDFILSWACSETANLYLVKRDNNSQAVKFTFETSPGKNANMACYKVFKNIDLGGGLSFWAKADIVFYVRITITIGEDTFMTVVKTSTEGKLYKIPFTAFWKVGDKSVGIDTDADHTFNISQLVFWTGSTINPPSIQASNKGEWIVDDIKFVNSDKEIAYPEAYDITKEGVRFQSAAGQFPVLTTIEINRIPLSKDEEAQWLEAMGMAGGKIDRMLGIKAFDMNGNSIDPEGMVTLTFDVPAGVKADKVFIYQTYIDGSVELRECDIVDGKLVLKTYRLGTFAVVVDKCSLSPGGGDSPDTGAKMPLAALAFATLSAGALIFVRKRFNNLV